MLRKINLLLAIIATLIISNTIFAQQNEDLEKEVESRMTILDSQRKSTIERSNKPGSSLPCPLGLHSTITAGINDNLAPPFEATFKNPALAVIFPNTKNFDDPAVNQIFAHSFSLNSYKPCESRICKAQLLIRICNRGEDLWRNDKLYVGWTSGSIFSSSIFYGNIWSGNEANQCKDVKIPINPLMLISPAYLDVVMQDDSTIDYMQLDLDF